MDVEAREAAYKRAAHLYAEALKTGGAALKTLGTNGYRLSPTPQEFHNNVLSVAEFLTAADAVPPGPCWHNSGITWLGEEFPVHCDLLAGHAGAHQADRGSRGGTAVWTETTPPHPDHSADGAESEREHG